MAHTDTVQVYPFMLMICFAGLFVGMALMLLVPWMLAHKFIKKEKELKGQFSEYYREVLEVGVANNPSKKKGGKKRKNKKGKKKLRTREDFMDPNLHQIKVPRKKGAAKKKTKVDIEREVKTKQRRKALDRAWNTKPKEVV